jgi:Zn-dependent protease with chaperone function
MDADLPNAFRVGRLAGPNTLVVTKGLLQRLDADEAEAVIAHELAHLANHDALVMVVVSFPARVLRAIAPGFTSVTRRNPVGWIAVLYFVPLFVGASGGGLAAVSLAILAAPLIFTFVGLAVLAAGG